jgi:hypothetical protein
MRRLDLFGVLGGTVATWPRSEGEKRMGDRFFEFARLSLIALGLASCSTAAQVSTDRFAYCEAHPAAILPDNTDCSAIANRTGAE